MSHLLKEITMDYFKKSFRYYKHKRNPEVLGEVIDFDSQKNTKCATPYKIMLESNAFHSCSSSGLVPHQQWDVYSFKNLDGLFYIRNPFTVEGQQYWIQKCLEEYPRKPSRTNLDRHHKGIDDIWSLQQDVDPVKRKLIDNLSWATLGYHYNWDNKVYNPAVYSLFPKCLAELAKNIAFCLDFRTFKPETAIINYYNSKSTLGIHTDHSEEELDQPIVSISFGQSAVFLMGTESRTEKPVPIFLRSGDVILMSGKSRVAYHAIPTIIQESVCNRYCSTENEMWKHFHQYIQTHRINISVRQVYRNNLTELK